LQRSNNRGGCDPLFPADVEHPNKHVIKHLLLHSGSVKHVVQDLLSAPWPGRITTGARTAGAAVTAVAARLEHENAATAGGGLGGIWNFQHGTYSTADALENFIGMLDWVAYMVESVVKQLLKVHAKIKRRMVSIAFQSEVHTCREADSSGAECEFGMEQNKSKQ